MKRVLPIILAYTLILGLAFPAMAAEPNFSDIPANADYAQAVAWCVQENLMHGVSATSFDPDGTMTRAMIATVLYRAEGEPAVTGNPVFNDVQPNVWYSNAIVWASSKGIVQGYGNGLFGTNDPITKEQLDVVIRRYNGESPAWTGNPVLAVPATRSEAAVAFYTNLREEEPGKRTAKDGAVMQTDDPSMPT